MNKVYLENGNAVKSAWDGSIALSYIPTVGRAIPYALTIEKYDTAGGDFAGETLKITPVVIANKFWVVKNMAGDIQTDHYFNDIEFAQEGEYRFIYRKSSTGVVTLKFFKGKDTTEVIYKTSIEAKHLIGTHSYYGIKFTLNTGISTDTEFEGIIEYRRTVVCIGDEETLELGGTERARCFAAATTPLYTNPENEVRFYVKEKGSYKLLDDTDAASKEVSKVNLVSDALVKKTDIVSIVKVATINAVELCLDNKPSIRIRGGMVANKDTFTDNISGVTEMYNTIQSWL